jgi:hypothetical protein
MLWICLEPMKACSTKQEMEALVTEAEKGSSDLEAYWRPLVRQLGMDWFPDLVSIL